MRLGAWVTASANDLLSQLFEPPCAACKAILRSPLDGSVCDACWAALRAAPPIHELFDRSHAIASIAAVDVYEGRMKDIIHALKYDRRRSISPRLGALMRERGALLLRDADCVVPVPLHPRREYSRGFNQAHDLAIHLGPPVVALLARAKHTRPQIELAAYERHANVAEAFSLRPSTALGATLSLSKGRPSAFSHLPAIVVLVDDVSTTGATLESCAGVLKAAGVKEVRALTAARVVNARR